MRIRASSVLGSLTGGRGLFLAGPLLAGLLLAGLLLSGLPLGLAAELRGDGASPLRAIDPARHFALDRLPSAAALRSDPAALAAVAADALRYRRAAPSDPAVGPGIVGELGLDSTSLEGTLAWLSAQTPAHLADPAFLARCLDAWRWTPDRDTWGGDLRLTRYLVYEVQGRAARAPEAPFALYAIPDDEAGLSDAEAEAKKAELLRFRYTRQEVTAGVYLEGGAAAGRARPLVWLDRPRHEQAILQGTIAVHVDGAATPRLFNVHRHNGIPYDRSVTDTREQRRYWYFREVDRVGGWGADPVPRIALQPGVAVAGDVYNLGVGRLIALSTRDGLRLVVLADTGGAFLPNLHQLDLYTGFFPDHTAFSKATAAIGDTARAWLLVARPEREGCGAARPTAP